MSEIPFVSKTFIKLQNEELPHSVAKVFFPRKRASVRTSLNQWEWLDLGVHGWWCSTKRTFRITSREGYRCVFGGRTTNKLRRKGCLYAASTSLIGISQHPPIILKVCITNATDLFLFACLWHRSQARAAFDSQHAYVNSIRRHLSKASRSDLLRIAVVKHIKILLVGPI